jgi:hypothetical protein
MVGRRWGAGAGSVLAVATLGLFPAVAGAQVGVPLPPRMPTMTRAPCPGEPAAPGCAIPGIAEGCSDPAGCVFLPSDYMRRYNRWHELGHIFDAQVLTERDRWRFTRLLGFGGGPWLRGTGVHGGMRSPSEWFADAYAHCALGLDGRFRAGQVLRIVVAYGYDPSPRQSDRVCAAIRFTAMG